MGTRGLESEYIPMLGVCWEYGDEGYGGREGGRDAAQYGSRNKTEGRRDGGMEMEGRMVGSCTSGDEGLGQTEEEEGRERERERERKRMRMRMRKREQGHRRKGSCPEEEVRAR